MIIDELTITNHLPVPGLYGLVLCGGNSSRMGIDKGMLVYHQKPQRYHVYQMLQPVCEKVFISCNAKQATGIEAGYNILSDLHNYYNTGPIAALLTAFTQYPDKDLLIIGCDYPFLEATDLYSFLSHCKGDMSVAFYNESGNLYEPLLAYYHRNSAKVLLDLFSKGEYSLQHFLRKNHAIRYYPRNKKSTIGINTMDEHLAVKESIHLENQ